MKNPAASSGVSEEGELSVLVYAPRAGNKSRSDSNILGKALAQLELKGADDANLLHRRAGRAIGAGLVVAIAAEYLNQSLVRRMDFADGNAGVGGELLRDGARIPGRLGEQPRP